MKKSYIQIVVLAIIFSLFCSSVMAEQKMITPEHVNQDGNLPVFGVIVVQENDKYAVKYTTCTDKTVGKCTLTLLATTPNHPGVKAHSNFIKALWGSFLFATHSILSEPQIFPDPVGKYELIAVFDAISK